MKCPHCLVDFHAQENVMSIGQDIDANWAIVRDHCPSCKRFVLRLAKLTLTRNSAGQLLNAPLPSSMVLCRPKGISRTPPPKEVPQEFAKDYREAGLVLADSPQASAALSRRCLQNILRERAKVKQGDLFSEIEEVLNRGTLPSHIADCLHTVRVIGNFAAHPTKSTSTGEIVPVEDGEAEWNLDTLEALFDFYFVEPEKTKARKVALNAKLQAAGKPPVK
jgi:uncharacterized protein DUF4145